MVLASLDSTGFVRLVDCGENGKVVNMSGKDKENLVFIVMEYVQGGILYNLCEKLGALGEDGGRFFARQIVDAVDYMHQRGVAHRDLKPENILVDENLNVKIADFGFSAYDNIT